MTLLAAEIAAGWRTRAVLLDRLAAAYRREGDDEHARELEEAATDYRNAADALDTAAVQA